MGTKQHHYPTVAHKLSCSSFPSQYYLSLLVSNSNINSNSDAAAKRQSAVETRGPSRQSIGFVESIVYQTAGAPLERVKLLIQCQGETVKSGRLTEPFKGVHDCFKRIIKNEGLLSLWRGNFTALINIFSSEALKTIFHPSFRQIFNFEKDDDGIWKRIAGNVACHTAAEVSSAFFYYPLHYARTRLANDVITVAKNKKNVAEKVAEVLVTAIILAAYHPLDTIERRMMMTSGEAYKYKNGIDAFSQILKNEGFKSFYKGFGVLCLQRIVASFSQGFKSR